MRLAVLRLAVLVALPLAAQAQTPDSTSADSVAPAAALADAVTADSACTLATCGIEFRGPFFYRRLHRGDEPIPFGPPFGLGIPRLAEAVEDSPAAVVHARAYERRFANVLFLEVGALVLSRLAVRDDSGLGTEARVTASVVSLGLAGLALRDALRGRSSMRAAIETYNASLPPAP